MSDTENVSIVKISLGQESDFALYQLIVEYARKSYVKDVFVKYKDETIAMDYPATLEFFSILDSLVKKGLTSGDENVYFEYKQKSEKNNTIIRSLRFKHDPTLYISPATAKTMCQFYNESKVGLSFRAVLKSETVLSFEAELETISAKAYFPSDKSLETVIESLLDDNGITYDNTPYYSQKITKLMDAIKNTSK